MKVITLLSVTALLLSTVALATISDDMDTQFGELMKRFEELEQEVQERDQTIDQLVQEVDEDQKQINKLAKEVDKDQKQIDKLYKATNNLKKQNKTTKKEIKRNTNDINTNAQNISTNTLTNVHQDGQISKITKDIEVIEDAVDECIDDYYSISGEYCGEWVNAKIVKLPVWGDQQVDVYATSYFQYPSEKEFAKFSPDVKLDTLIFEDFDLLVAQVGVHLSNGYYAGTHEGLVNHDNHVNKTISFDWMPPIRAVGAVSIPKAIESLEYYDSDGNRWDKYDPSGIQFADSSEQHELQDNQELIGVYGVKNDNGSYFKSFGYLVKEKQTP